MEITFHYPPELLQLLIDAIPRLCRAKGDVILFFRGAGVEQQVFADLERQLAVDSRGVNKYAIARTVLTRLNEAGEVTLRERREIIRRVVEFEDFSTCWPNDQLKAKGLVAEIQRVINVKDSFTRMRQERDDEARKHREGKRIEAEKIVRKREELESIRAELYSLFGDQNAQGRGRRLEAVLNRLFRAASILIRESFARVDEPGEGVVEQIDGVIELDGEIYLVEVKWLKNSVGVADVSRHLVRVFTRDASRGIFISYTDYTAAALTTCKEALARSVVVLCKLQELVLLLERGEDLAAFLKAKVHASIVDKEPFSTVLPG
ncbi:MAG: restriction endonuclease [Thermoanaerobaculia bacterium]